MTEPRRVAVIVGANSGLGSTLASLLLSRGFGVAALGREGAVASVANEAPGALPLVCDVSIAGDVSRAFDDVEAKLGLASVVVYNAHRIELRSAAETPLELFEESWRVNCFGAFAVAQRVLPALQERGGGTLIFSGATSSTRGGRRSAAFASSKFALRGLAQSLAREYSSAGVHVAHVVLDGLIWSERTRARFAPDERACMSPVAVAKAYLALIEQEPSAWTHELDLAPPRRS